MKESSTCFQMDTLASWQKGKMFANKSRYLQKECTLGLDEAMLTGLLGTFYITARNGGEVIVDSYIFE